VIRDLAFAYAQARIQAGFAALPTEAEWQRLGASRSFPSFLEDARGGPIGGWVKGFSARSDAHDLEAGVRSLFGETLDRVTAWVPGRWRAAVAWVRWLPLLPLLSHVQAGGALPAWARRDPVWQNLQLPAGLTSDPTAGTDPAAALVTAWMDGWRSLWPHCGRRAARELEVLAGLLRGHVEGFRQAAPAAAWRLRRELGDRLRLRFHSQVLAPTVPFLFLALTALELERLRAALLGRLLFDSADGMPGAGAF